MGQSASCGRSNEVCPQAVRIVHLTCQVEDFPRPVKVKQVVKQHPHHFVCSWRDLPAITTRGPLAAEYELRVGELYLVLPISTIESNMSPKTLAALAHRLLNAARKGASKPAQESTGDSKPRFGSSSCSMYEKLMERCDNPELLMAHKEHLVTKAKPWRPRLHTIDETCHDFDFIQSSKPPLLVNTTPLYRFN